MQETLNNRKTMQITYKYSIDHDWLPDAYAIEIDEADEDDFDYIAELCAEDYHQNHDGWESHRPLDMYLFKEDKCIAQLKVELEHSPVFSASLINTTS